ncbi:MAG: ZIP family metal transporter [Thermoleophilaceae bacterium]|nr:ZIP family metal transporter [Thermoleophilaceae bacterium]
MSELLTVFLAGVATMLATGIGALPVHYLGDRAYNWRPALVGVAIGAMSVAAVVGLLQPGLELGTPLEVWGGAALGGVLFFAVRMALHRNTFSIVDVRGSDRKRAALIFAVLFAHSLPEGFAVGTAYASPDQNLGLFVILAIALQNVPEGTSVAIPMEDAGISVWRQFWAAVGTSIPQPIGAVIAYLLVDQITGLLPISFGFAAGAMIVLVAVELVPDGFAPGTRVHAAVGTALGAAVIFLLESAVVG